MAELTDTDIREQVRERYAGHAKLAIDVSPGAARQAEEACCGTTGQSSPFGDVLYDTDSSQGAWKPRSRRRSVAASRPRSPTCTRAKPCSTSAPAPAPTSSSPPAALAPPAARSGST